MGECCWCLVCCDLVICVGCGECGYECLCVCVECVVCGGNFEWC